MDDPWFTIYRGPATFRLRPRSLAGGMATGLMVLLISALLLLSLPFLVAQPVLILVPLAVTTTILFAFIRFAIARATIVNVDESAPDPRRPRGGKRN